jgi:flagellar basal body-associated protein FliL
MEEPFSKDLEDKDLKDNKQNSLSIKLVIALLIIIGILIAVIVVLVFFIILKDGNDKDKNTETKSEEEPKLENRIILFQQPKETDSAKHIIVHIPEKEIFMSTLHPAASLYEAVTDDVKVKQCFNELKSILKEKKIELITVRSALKLNKTALKKLASEALKYE